MVKQDGEERHASSRRRWIEFWDVRQPRFLAFLLDTDDSSSIYVESEECEEETDGRNSERIAYVCLNMLDGT